jgi:hypothetical protein
VKLEEKDLLTVWGIVVDQSSGQKDARNQEKREPAIPGGACEIANTAVTKTGSEPAAS